MGNNLGFYGICMEFLWGCVRFLWSLYCVFYGVLWGFMRLMGYFFGLDPPNIHLKTLEKQAMFSAVIVSQLIITFQVLQWLKGM
jgi:hypothetical protein